MYAVPIGILQANQQYWYKTNNRGRAKTGGGCLGLNIAKNTVSVSKRAIGANV